MSFEKELVKIVKKRLGLQKRDYVQSLEIKAGVHESTNIKLEVNINSK